MLSCTFGPWSPFEVKRANCQVFLLLLSQKMLAKKRKQKQKKTRKLSIVSTQCTLRAIKLTNCSPLMLANINCQSVVTRHIEVWTTSREMVFFQSYPERFYFEGLLESAGALASAPTVQYLPIYFGNVCLRFLPVSAFSGFTASFKNFSLPSVVCSFQRWVTCIWASLQSLSLIVWCVFISHLFIR